MKKLFGFLALAGLLGIAVPVQKAEAAVLAPGVAASVQGAAEGMTTEVQYRRRGYAPRRYYAPRRSYAPRVFVPRVFAPRRSYY